MCFVRFQKINSHSFIHSQLQVMQNGTHGTVNYVQKRPTNNMRNPSTTHRYQKETQSNNVGQPKCKYCGRRHVKRECPAYRQTCIKCGRKIFSSQMQCTLQHTPYLVYDGLVGHESRLRITMEVAQQRTQRQVPFRIDTGAECNILLQKSYSTNMSS